MRRIPAIFQFHRGGFCCCLALLFDVGWRSRRRFSHMTEFWITSFTKLCRYVYYVATNKTLSLQISRSILVSDHTDDRTEWAPISFFIHKPTIGIGIWMDIGVMMMVVRHLYGSADWLCPSKTGWVAETERDGISRPANQLKCPKTYSAETALH